jgi:hypothetical protein
VKITLVWPRRDDPSLGTRAPKTLTVEAAWPTYGGWFCYRLADNPNVTHYIPPSAVDEIIVAEEPADPDPMETRAP